MVGCKDAFVHDDLEKQVHMEKGVGSCEGTENRSLLFPLVPDLVVSHNVIGFGLYISSLFVNIS